MPRKCKCAGSCVPQAAPEVSRREFISLVGLGAAGTLIGGPASSEEDLAAWLASLSQPSARRRYLSGVHRDVKFPLGGIGTGNIEVGADGRFSTWQLFNTLRDGYVPFHLAVRSGGVARVLETESTLDWPCIRSIELTGEYPIAELDFHDDSIPVRLKLKLFTPFSPLDAPASSLPVVCAVLRIHNPTQQEQEVSVGAFLQNAVGYDATGVNVSFNSYGFNAVGERHSREHADFGGNYNRTSYGQDHTALFMEAEPAGPPKLSKPVVLYTSLNPGAFRSPYGDIPPDLRVRTVAELHGGAPPVVEGAEEIIWLEEPDTSITGATLETARTIVSQGGTLVFSGRAMPLLEAYARITGGEASRANLTPDILFEDFERDYENWAVEGEAFGSHPAQGTLPGQQPVKGFLGHGLVNSFLHGDGSTGRLVSRTFTISRRFVRFLVGGGSRTGTQIRLMVNGKVVRATSGRDDEQLLPAAWDVHDLAGQTAHIEIVDRETGGWGHINVDEIKFSDYELDAAVVHALDAILPVRFGQAHNREGALVTPENITTVAERFLPHNASPDPREVTGRLERGAVAILMKPLLPAAEAESIGPRRLALKELCRLSGVELTGAAGVPPLAPGFGALALASPDRDLSLLPQFRDWSEAWTWFTTAGPNDHVRSRASAVRPVHTRGSGGEMRTHPTGPGATINGGLTAHTVVPAGQTRDIRLVLAWRYPNKYNEAGVLIGNHYATLWPDIDGIVSHAATAFNALHEATERFRKTFYRSTLPYWMLDAVSSQISTIRHTGVVFRIANGDIYGWEGSNGCCQPTCTHVWGYEQALARLFPDLEREMRRIDYRHQQHPDGGIGNRTEVPSPPHPSGEFPFADGHASCVLKAYREALNAPDDRFLHDYYPAVKRAVEYLIARDAATSHGRPDGTLEDAQWNTYDEALHGVTTFISGYYLAALRAGEEWAKRVGDLDAADRFGRIFALGQAKLVRLCWNGEYFEQYLPEYRLRSGEVGPGCMSDQLIGQWWAHQLGLGYILPREHVVAALKSITRYNWKPDLTGWKHSPRAFAGAGDKGLIICTWPRGGRPDHVMLYSDEVWTGIEYQVAAHLIYEGQIEEGLAIVKGLRDRYDGLPRAPIPRNPWNEIECGGHYARAMASWSLLLAVSGFHYDAPAAALRFAPRMTPHQFRCFFTGSEGWGSIAQHRAAGKQVNSVTMVGGTLKIDTLHLDCAAKAVKARMGNKVVKVTSLSAGGTTAVRFEVPVILRAAETLTVDAEV